MAVEQSGKINPADDPLFTEFGSAVLLFLTQEN
jgi:hypothetical protein